jgi:MFS family permease
VSARYGWTAQTSTVAALGTAQTLAWASSYYLPAMIAAPMARDVGVETSTVFAAFSAALIVSAFLGPYAGRAIDTWGGRPVLAVTSLLFAGGLTALGLANGPVGMFAGWLLLGVGMGSGLYEAAFAALVRLQGDKARPAITGITLFAGFASTVGWPLTSLLEAQYGWREACFTWAALHLLLGLPLNLSLPRAEKLVPTSREDARKAGVTSPAPLPPELPPSNPPPDRAPPSFLTTALLAYVFAATWFISTAMAAHLPRLLEASGATLAAAVAAGALVGPAQVAARLLEFGLLKRVHPLYSAIVAAVMHPLAAVALLFMGAPAALFAVLHGAGNGILTIAKGTLPLVLFGPRGYGHRQGLLTVPARMAQALAPYLFGICLDRWGAGALWLSAMVGLSAFAALWLIPRTSETA